MATTTAAPNAKHSVEVKDNGALPHANGRHDNFIEKFEHMPLGYGDDRHDIAAKEGIRHKLEAPGVHEKVCPERHLHLNPHD